MGILTSESLTIWTKSRMQDSCLVSGNIYNASKGRVFPNGQLVVRHAVTGDNLSVTKRVNIDLLYYLKRYGELTLCSISSW